jgi:hypothetical protein
MVFALLTIIAFVEDPYDYSWDTTDNNSSIQFSNNACHNSTAEGYDRRVSIYIFEEGK